MASDSTIPKYLRIGIAGIWGRMGQTLLGEILRSDDDFLFAAGSEATTHSRFGDPLLDPRTRAPLGSSAFGEPDALFEVSGSPRHKKTFCVSSVNAKKTAGALKPQAF